MPSAQHALQHRQLLMLLWPTSALPSGLCSCAAASFSRSMRGTKGASTGSAAAAAATAAACSRAACFLASAEACFSAFDLRLVDGTTFPAGVMHKVDSIAALGNPQSLQLLLLQIQHVSIRAKTCGKTSHDGQYHADLMAGVRRCHAVGSGAVSWHPAPAAAWRRPSSGTSPWPSASAGSSWTPHPPLPGPPQPSDPSPVCIQTL